MGSEERSPVPAPRVVEGEICEMPPHLHAGMQHDHTYYERAYRLPTGLGALVSAIFGW